MHIGTIFDLASLTKVVATTTATLALVGQGALALDDAVIGFLPRFEAGPAGPVTVRHLLTHTSGLPQSRKFHRWCRSGDRSSGELYQTPLEAPPGSRVVYSDLGFMALGEVVAVVTGGPLDRATADLVTGPLAMTATASTRPGHPSLAATEAITAIQRGTASPGPAPSTIERRAYGRRRRARRACSRPRPTCPGSRPGGSATPTPRSGRATPRRRHLPDNACG